MRPRQRIARPSQPRAKKTARTKRVTSSAAATRSVKKTAAKRITKKSVAARAAKISAAPRIKKKTAAKQAATHTKKKAATRAAASRRAVRAGRIPAAGTGPNASAARDASSEAPRVSLPATAREPDLAWRQALPGEVRAGVAMDYLNQREVVLAMLERPLACGDLIHIRGYTTDFYQRILSLQVDHQNVPEAAPGQAVGIRIHNKTRKHDIIYHVVEYRK